jgi:hypothetical protein
VHVETKGIEMLDYFLFKQIHDLYKEGETETAKLILKDLQEKYIELNDENMLLKTQIQEYEDILYLAKNLEYDGFSYWLKTAGVRQGPFCRACFDRDSVLIRLHEAGPKWKCLSCGSEYERRNNGSHGLSYGAREREPPAKVAANKVIQLYK